MRGPCVPFRRPVTRCSSAVFFLGFAWVVTQDIIAAKEQLQQFERMQTLQLWLTAESSHEKGATSRLVKV